MLEHRYTETLYQKYGKESLNRIKGTKGFQMEEHWNKLNFFNDDKFRAGIDPNRGFSSGNWSQDFAASNTDFNILIRKGTRKEVKEVNVRNWLRFSFMSMLHVVIDEQKECTI